MPALDNANNPTESRGLTLDSLEEPLFMTDKAFNISWSNAAFNKLVGQGQDSMVGRKCHEILRRTEEPPPYCLQLKTRIDRQPVSELLFEPHLHRELLVSVSVVRNGRCEIWGSLHVIREGAPMAVIDELARSALRLVKELEAFTIGMLKAAEGLEDEIEERVRAEAAANKNQEHSEDDGGFGVRAVSNDSGASIWLVKNVAERARWFQGLFMRVKETQVQGHHLLQSIAATSVFEPEDTRKRIALGLHWATYRLMVWRNAMREVRKVIVSLDPETATTLRELESDATRLAISCHRLARRIRPPVPPKVDLAALLRTECAGALEKERLEITIEADGPGTPLVTPRISDFLSGLLVEWIRLAEHDFHALSAQVTLTLTERAVRLSIQNDGDAHIHRSPESDLNYVAMDLAAKSVRGTMRIGLKPSGGATLTVEVPRRAEPSPQVLDLSERQKAVLLLLAEGRLGKEIAMMLKISTKTVEFHKYSMMRTLGVKSVPELIRLAIRHGLIPA